MSLFNSSNPRAFTGEEVTIVQDLLEGVVRALRNVPGGAKMEEGHWSFIYHRIRGANVPGWSNLPMRDFAHAGLGVEMKLLQRESPIGDQGRRLMHPAATRAISFDPSDPAEISKVRVLQQFGQQMSSFRERVAEASGTDTAEIRWGVFLWSPTLDEFLYFEELMTEPNPENYSAEFVVSSHRGKPTRNLHIFERDTGIKRFSVTMPDKGAKVQPYFDVPLVGQGSYAFNVPNDDREPIWLPKETVKRIEESADGRNLDEYLRDRLEL